MHILARSSRRRAIVAGIAAVCLAAVAAGTASASLPNPCTLLTNVHPEHTFGHGKTLTVRDRTQHRYGSGKYGSVTCSETVGTQPVSISLSGAAPGGFGGIMDPKTSHPSGLGAGASLITAKGVPNGGPVDFVLFHRGTVYVDLSANGATPALLTTFARQVYAALA